MHTVEREHKEYLVVFDSGRDDEASRPIFKTTYRSQAFEVCSWLNGGEKPPWFEDA